MNSVVSLFFVLFIGCASAGLVVDLITRTTAMENGHKELTPYGREDTTTFRFIGTFVMELAPFQNTLGVTQTYVRLLWRTPQQKYYPLELIRMNWPSGKNPSIALAKLSIIPVAVDSNTLQLTVKYLKASTEFTKTYNWNSKTYE